MSDASRPGPAEIAKRLQDEFGDKIVAVDLEAVDPFCQVDPMAVDEIATFLRDRLGFNYLRCLSSVDYLDKKKTSEELGVVYHLGAIPDARHLFCLKVRLPRDEPTVKTVSAVWPTADWHEREAWDLMGIVFEGHPNLTRILCAEDWEGHPLRKDYVSPDTYHGIKNNVV
ncbi:MAG: NADH-quinone oxidoreductase subunit C [Planctomycetes bacterium]|nr:NADH-quinone oxidoreductase subunit C [Planctomycetota bacterium]